MMAVRFSDFTLVVLLTLSVLKTESFPVGPLAAALKRKSVDFTPALSEVSKH
jgi:hypothetical protein